MAHNAFNFAFIVGITLVCTVHIVFCKGSPKKEKCIIENCRLLINTTAAVNFCTEDDNENEVQKCINKLNEECPEDLRTIYLTEKVKLIHSALCGRSGLDEKFAEHPECWPKAQECLNPLVTPENMLKGKVCDIKKVNNDRCKVRDDISMECAAMHAQFLELAFQESQCCGASFTVSTLLITVALVSAIYSRN